MFYKIYRIDGERKYYSGCYDGIPHFSVNKRNGVLISASDIEKTLVHLRILQKHKIHHIEIINSIPQ